jgi:uncharacterized protein YprB with RNaseH-like and TPR domain
MTIPDDLRRKLEALNRGPLTVSPVGADPRVGPGDAGTDLRVGPKKAALEDLVPGEVIGAPERPVYRVARALDDLMPNAADLTREFRSVWLAGRYAISDDELARAWREIVETDPQRLLFVDIETCGLAATPVFLVGLMHLDGERFRLVQFFARDYAEERHLLAHAAEAMRDFETLVTYNGKAFDWPYLCDRSVYHAVSMPAPAGHLDLLHEARRRWKTVLPNCKLQTMEYHVSGRRRAGDIPGSLIPEAYHQFVRSGNARQMADVIHHNALDLVTMAELMLFILQGGDLVWE